MPLLALVLLGPAACRSGESSGHAAGEGAANEPSAQPAAATTQGFKYLRQFDVISGVLPVQLALPARQGLQLVAAGKTVATAKAGESKLRWDTSVTADGLVPLVLQRAGKQLQRTRVVVMNRGAEVFFKNGNQGTLPQAPGAAHEHLRFHWDLSQGRQVVAVLTWDKPGFRLGLDLGRGSCPHHGEKMAGVEGDSSPLVVRYAAEAGKSLPAGQWFLHVRQLARPDDAKVTTELGVRAYVFQ